MAISTQGTILNISNTLTGAGAVNIDVAIKSYPDLGAAPTPIEVTTLSDDAQKFIPGIRSMAAMEFVANYDSAQFTILADSEDKELTYKLNFGTDSYEFSGKHNALIVGGGLNAAVDMKVVVLPTSKINKSA